MFELQDYFSFVDGGDIGITKGSQLAAMKNAGTIDDRAIMVGDRYIDIKSARENGLNSIGVLWGFGDYQELSGASPTYIIENMEEILDIIKIVKATVPTNPDRQL